MKRLILHIGMHKTATTAIQNTLAAQKETLQAQSAWYGSTDRPPDLHLSKHASLFAAATESDAAFAAERAVILEDFAASGCDTLILSEERLSFPMYKKFERLKKFREDFDEITVVCYLRRPDILMESLWNQHCKNGIEARDVLVYSRNRFVLEGIKFCKILDFWADVADIKVVDFDVAKRQGVVDVFSELIGIDVGKEADAINVSPGMNCAVVLAALNRLGAPYPKEKILKAFADDREKHGLGSKRRGEILNLVAPELEALEKKYGIAFNMTLPEERSVPLIRPDTEAVANAMVRLEKMTR